MQENDFEKQVQQKAGELKLMPSEEVWQKVAAAVVKRRRDRSLLALALLLLLLTGTGLLRYGILQLIKRKYGNCHKRCTRKRRYNR